jgi:hypothetical protein
MLNIYVSFTPKFSPEDIVLIGRQQEITISRSTKGTIRLQESHSRAVSFLCQLNRSCYLAENGPREMKCRYKLNEPIGSLNSARNTIPRILYGVYYLARHL